MARTALPRFLLVHTITVEAYRAWNDFAAPASHRCFVAEAMAGGAAAGVERVAQITAYLPLNTDCPQGSRITLPGDRRGYAAAVARFDGGGLPTPDHLEVAVQVASGVGPAFGESVILLYRTRRRSAGGGVQIATRTVTLDGAAVRLLTQSETTAGSAPQAVDTIEVILPPGTVIGVGDALIVRGLTYEVDGTPEIIGDSNTVAQPGVRVIGKRRI